MIKFKSKMRVINPETKDHVFNDLNDCKNSIFLAGPCPENYEDDWRTEAISILESLGFSGTIINPTNPYYDSEDSNHLSKQTRWEREAMYKASSIVFWIERSEEHPAYTTNIEFGDWYDKPGVFVGWTDKAIKNNYLLERLKIIGKPRYTTLKDTLKAAVDDLNRKQKRWFISDTHFSQPRTLELSKRPFRNIEEMDLELISRWNKNIRQNDIVYHLGDFGENFDYLRLLNYKTFNFILGNYERENEEKSLEELKNYPQVVIYKDRGDCRVSLGDGKEVICIHEPLDPDNKTNYENELCLYGHIHGRTMYKLNGTDVAVDSHYFTPLSEEEVIWRLNAIKYLDDNVWSNKCK